MTRASVVLCVMSRMKFLLTALSMVVTGSLLGAHSAHAATNLITNPGLETVDPANSSKPQGWSTGRWGTNTVVFTYPVTGIEGARAARVTMMSRSSGDAKWYHTEVPVSAGETYEFSSYGKGTVNTYITAQFRKNDGSYIYIDLGTRGHSTTWTQFKTTFNIPDGVVGVTVFHLINSVGTLDIDKYSLVKLSSDPTVFDKGYVSLNFDDGWLSAYTNAMPILNAAGFKTDQYIVTDYLTDNYPGYVKPSQVLDMQAHGHVIGAHTRTHPDLTLLSSSQQQEEIAGSRQDLLALGAQPINTFAYPLGAYNDTVIQQVKNAGFVGARSSNGGLNDKKTSPYILNRISMENTTTFDQVKSNIDKALSEKKWVILLFHEVNTSGHRYSVTPALLQQIVDYLKQKGIVPISNEQGLAKMKQ